MALTRESLFGKKGDGPATAVPFIKDSESYPSGAAINAPRGDNMSDKKFKVICGVLIEKGVRHINGEFLKVEIDAERATALKNAGYIDDVETIAAPVVKAIEASPVDKMIGEAPESKGATGKGADLLKKKSKK